MIDLKKYQVQEPKGLLKVLNTPARKILVLTAFLGALSTIRMGNEFINSDLQPGGRNDLAKITQEAESRNHTSIHANGKTHVGHLVSDLSTRTPANGYMGPGGRLYAMEDRVSK